MRAGIAASKAIRGPKRPARSSAATVPPLNGGSHRSSRRRLRLRRARRLLVYRRSEVLLEFGDRRSGERIADHVGRAAAHVEELVDAEDEEEARLRNAELLQRRQDH